MISKEVWVQNIISFIEQIASAEFQEKGWVNNEIHDYCTFVETMCGLFDDSNFEEFIDNEAAGCGYTEEQIRKLDELRCALNAFDLQHGCYEDPAIIVKDPEWLKIRELANEALKSLGIEYFLDPSKAIFKDSLLNSIYYLADPEAKTRWCMQERGSEHLFDELMNGIFKKGKFAEIVTCYKEYEITDEEIEVLRKFYNALNAYREKKQGAQDIREIFNDPEWHKIQSLAGEVVKVFDYKL
ncbi:MAG TPA: hypothetical protein VFU89_05890 [Rhabdochlamydiaceae bacterium]|nr:hypothetical protein [Rhabdochlamydiaceae bacterium]